MKLRRRWRSFALGVLVIGCIAGCGVTSPAGTPTHKHQTSSANSFFTASEPTKTDPATQIVNLAKGFPQHVLASRAQEVTGGTPCATYPHGQLVITNTATRLTVMTIELCAKPWALLTFDLPTAPAGYDFTLEQATLASFNLRAIQ